jgi:hypothetical protein
LLKKLKAETRRVMREERKNQWNQFTESITAKTSLHEVWEKIRKISGKRKLHQIKRLIKSNSTLSSQRTGFSKTSFNENYPSNFRKKKEETERKKINIDLSNKEPFNGPPIEEELDEALSECKGSSSGLDDIHYEFLKKMDRKHD